ncbi:MAG: endolytic transglycosylase MltG [Bradyrhizobiaceae bacterium]|nr:endolytic transglycosylase MltG [Bradyrhizobiaceae bacterium]
MMAKKPTSSRRPRASLESGRIPPPTRRSRRARHPLVVAGNTVFTLLVILGVVSGATFVFGKQGFDAAGPLYSDKVVAIPKGLGTRDITDLLAKEGVINQPWLFIASAYIFKARGNDLKWGEYQFNKAASVHDVIATLVDGKVIQHKVTLAEGLTSEQIVQRILESDVLTGNIREIPREGTLLPQTYNIVRGTTREQLIQLMQKDQRRIVQEIWDHRSPDLPLKSPEQLVTLASIVEKETGKPEERSRVAAVFVNRLKQRMRLQSDPTIIYGLVGGKGSLGRPLMRSEVERPSPYNTYVIDGLPPGPIANPGLASLEATANPARTRELYFVADGTGGHAFAENLEQHQRNVAHLRQIEQQQPQVLAPWPGPAAATTESSPSPAAPSGVKPRARAAATKPATTD